MEIREVIATLNQMQADGIISRYAIGGAVAAAFYLEPAATLDVDVFAVFEPTPDESLVSLQPIFDYLKLRGGVMEREYIVIAGAPLQFQLPPPSALAAEAVNEAIERDVHGTPARIFRLEHLAAIALQTGRLKDGVRLLEFIDNEEFDPRAFFEILKRYELTDRWKQFDKKIRGDSP